MKGDILSNIENFSKRFNRQYKEDNFFSPLPNNFHFKDFKSMDVINSLKIIEPKKPNKINENTLIELNNKIYKYYEKLLEIYDYSLDDREEFDEMISIIFILLSNIYDLFPNFLEIYFKNDWLKLHLKLIDACLDLNDPPEPSLGRGGKEKFDVLSKFLLFFCLCISKDNDYKTRLHLLNYNHDLFYKIAIISACNSHFCCCGHGIGYYDTDLISNIKSIFLVFETFQYMENNNIKNDFVKQEKFNILEFYVSYIGKNSCIIYLNEMTSMLNSVDIFTYIVDTTDLLKEVLTNEDDPSLPHSIDAIETFVTQCKSSELIFKILAFISPPKTGIQIRIFQELLKNLSEIAKNKYQLKYLEIKLYNDDIFGKMIDTLLYNTYLGDYEGIWQILLDSNNSNIVEIFHRIKNKYDVGMILYLQVNNLVKEKLIGYRLVGAVKVMNLFIKMGNEIKKKYNVYNYYLEQFRDCYKMIFNLHIINDEDIDEFINYYINN